MAVNVRVQRGDRSRVPFANPNLETRSVGRDEQLGPDEALVGSSGDQATEIEIDPSEFNQNPFIGDHEEKDDWDLPKDQKEDKQQEPTRRSDTRQQSDVDEDEEDVRLAYDPEEGMGEERRSHRSRRNRARREAVANRDGTINELREVIARQGQMLSNLYGGQFNLSARDIDQRVSFNQAALERADIELARAIKEADGDSFAAIQRERDKIYRELWQLQGARQNLEEYARRMAQGGEVEQQQRQQPQQPQLNESEAERMRNVFMDRWDWFDPDSNDADSRFVKRLDRQVARELAEDGIYHDNIEYWNEMERGMREAGYRPDGERPQRRSEGGSMRNGSNGGGFTQRRYNGPPTGAVRSTMRAGNSRDGGYPLSDMQLDLLRDEGLDGPADRLSKEDAAKRDRIINKWRRGDEALARSRR